MRNWDYRYSWVRDAGIGVSAFLAVGKREEAHAFMHWLLHSGRRTRPRLRPLYTVHGRRVPYERSHDLPGHADSRPVRTGNQAVGQRQLDVYGWMLDAGHRFLGKEEIHPETWRMMMGAADVVARNWHHPDAGMWECRGHRRHFVHSKLMAWAALDRALRMGSALGVRARRHRTWSRGRDLLAEAIHDAGYDATSGSFRQSFDSSDPDAALLLVPLMGFEPPDSPRVVRTVGRIRDRLGAGGPLLYRYPPESDGLPGREGAFLPCSFWLVQVLAASGRVTEARQAFEALCDLAGPLGLYPEQIDPDTGGFLGNFPLAFSHATHVQAAAALDELTRE